jgi:hypothetical protein
MTEQPTSPLERLSAEHPHNQTLTPAEQRLQQLRQLVPEAFTEGG